MPGLSGAADEARDCLEDTLVTYIHTYDILNSFGVIDHFVQIDCMLMACSSKFGLFYYRSRP